MLAFHPYGQHDIRVVSDLSRYQFQNITPRNRSRDATPTSIYNEAESVDMLLQPPAMHRQPGVPLPRYIPDPKTLEFVTPVQDHQLAEAPRPEPEKRRTLLEIAELSMALPRNRKPETNYTVQNEIYNHYMKPSEYSFGGGDDEKSDFAPYPQSLLGRSHEPYLSPPVPSKEGRYEDLPAMLLTKDYLNPRRLKDKLKGHHPSSDNASLDSRRKDMEVHLVKNVMNKPLFLLNMGAVLNKQGYADRHFTITAHFLIYLFEIILAIIVITLSSLLVRQDRSVARGIYTYFIIDGLISLIVSFLFVTTVINFEKRNGSFYCLAACLLTVISFIIVTSKVITTKSCKTEAICLMRNATSAFIIVSTFIWVTNLVMFLTTLYISRLNLLEDINFDYSNRGVDREYNEKQMAQSQGYHAVDDGLYDPQSGKPLKEYYLNEHGEMYEIDDKMEVRGKNKIIVYTF